MLPEHEDHNVRLANVHHRYTPPQLPFSARRSPPPTLALFDSHELEAAVQPFTDWLA